jgi:mannose-6-phosphate isomerase-like protein (cupin superfamily)
MPGHVSQHRDQQHIQWLGSAQVRILLDGAATGGQFTLLEESFGVGDGSPLHVHYHEDETFWILDGALTAWIGDERVDASRGDVVFMPRGTPHAFRVTMAGSRAMILATPAGIEEMYRQAGWDLSKPVPADWSVSLAQVKSIGDRRQTPILGPAPTA